VGAVDKVGVPECHAGAAVRVERIQTIVLRSHEDDVVRYPADGEIGYPQRLRVNRTINGAGE
jgi:hypothetical protein